MGNPVVHFEYMAKDGKKLNDFYTQLFNWKSSTDDKFNYTMLETKDGDNGINGGLFQTEPPMPTGFTVYIQVDDLEQSLTKAEQLGGKTMMPPKELEGMGMIIAMFQDPEENLMGMIQFTGEQPSN